MQAPDQPLAAVPLFASLEPSALQQLSRCLVLKAYPEEDRIFFQGEPGRELFWILSGQVRISRETESGREVTLALRGPGEFIGEMAVLDGRPRSASGYAHGSTLRCLILQGSDLWAFLRSCPESSARIMTTLCERLREASDRIEDMACLTVRQRLAGLLVRLATTQGENAPEGGIALPRSVTYRTLVGLLGGTRESVSRAANEFMDDRLLEQSGRRFRVLDLEGLRAIARERP